MPSSWLARVLAGVAVAAVVSASAHAHAAPRAPAVAPGPSVTVQPGESWASVRGRMFPLDALQRANPQLDPSMLHPGEVVRAPYVSVAELDRARAAREAAERQLAEANGRIAAFEKERASLESRRREVARAEAAVPTLRGIMIALALVALALLVLVAVLAGALRAARRTAEDAVSSRGELQSRYEALRASLQEVELGLQRRVLSLLQLHGGRVVTEVELQASITPVIDLTRELKRKHKSA